jgi:hypothetical protein
VLWGGRILHSTGNRKFCASQQFQLSGYNKQLVHNLLLHSLCIFWRRRKKNSFLYPATSIWCSTFKSPTWDITRNCLANLIVQCDDKLVKWYTKKKSILREVFYRAGSKKYIWNERINTKTVSLVTLSLFQCETRVRCVTICSQTVYNLFQSRNWF